MLAMIVRMVAAMSSWLSEALPKGHRPGHSSSLLGLAHRILNMSPQEELLWGLWVDPAPGFKSFTKSSVFECRSQANEIRGAGYVKDGAHQPTQSSEAANCVRNLNPKP